MGMMDVYWRLSLSDAFETAEWQDKRIKVRVLSPQDLRRSNAGNLLSDEGYMTLQTRYVYDYKIDDRIKFRGKWYMIINVRRDTYEALPQATALMGGRLQDITLELFEVGDITRNLRVATPVITVYDGKVTITCDTLDAEIYYTVDGSRPSSVANLYKVPFAATDEQIKAIATKDGYMQSEVSTYGT